MERLDAFMARANAEYYATRDPFQDFTTAPEITQVFGELLGLWAADAWGAMGRPHPVLLAECGPGRGTLMADALRATVRVAPAFHAALRLHLVETSPRLRTLQAARLPGATWHDGIDTLPPFPLLLLANEFLDALPIRQFIRRGRGWTECFVADGTLVEQPAPAPAHPTCAHTTWAHAAADGETVELCEPALNLVSALASHLHRHGGAALFLDYGPAASAPGNSLQALRHGRPADPFANPGSADLTAHVDFASLAATARQASAAAHGPVPQGPFLTRLGLFQRTFQLARTQPPTRAAALIQAAQRLADPDRMGRLFKALCLCHPALPTPAGFEP